MSISILVLVVAFYAAVATAYAEARRRRESPPMWARWAGPVAVAAHLAGLLLLSMAMGRSPFATPSQALSFLAFSLVVLYLVLEATSHVATHGGGFYALAALLTAVSVPGLIQGDTVAWAAAPRDAARSLHIGLSLMSTAAVLAGALLGVGYLGTYARVKRKVLLGGKTGPSLAGFERLARRASLLGVALLVPALILGIRVERTEEAVGSLFFLTAAVAAQLILLGIAFLIWWRRPLRGSLAAWCNVAAALVLVVAFGVVHPLVLRGAV